MTSLPTHDALSGWYAKLQNGVESSLNEVLSEMRPFLNNNSQDKDEKQVAPASTGSSGSSTPMMNKRSTKLKISKVQPVDTTNLLALQLSESGMR